MSNHGLNCMTKQELRAKLDADYREFVKQNGQPDLYAAQTSPQEHYRLCGSSMKRKKYREHDAKQEAYQEWLRTEQQRQSA